MLIPGRGEVSWECLISYRNPGIMGTEKIRKPSINLSNYIAHSSVLEKNYFDVLGEENVSKF